MFYAVKFNRAQILKKLIEKGGDFNKIDKFGFTPLYYAKVYSFKDIIEILQDINGVDVAIDNIMNIKTMNNQIKEQILTSNLSINDLQKNNKSTRVTINDDYSNIKITTNYSEEKGDIIETNLSDKNNKEIYPKRNSNILQKYKKQKYILIKIINKGSGFKKKKLKDNEIECLYDENPFLKRLIEDPQERIKIIQMNNIDTLFSMKWENIARDIILNLAKFIKRKIRQKIGSKSIFNIDIIKEKLTKSYYTNPKEFIFDVNEIINSFIYNYNFILKEKNDGSLISSYFKELINQRHFEQFIIDF